MFLRSLTIIWPGITDTDEVNSRILLSHSFGRAITRATSVAREAGRKRAANPILAGASPGRGEKLVTPLSNSNPKPLILRPQRTCKLTGSTAHAWKAKHPMLPEAFPTRDSPRGLFD